MGVCGPYLTLRREDAPQRDYSLREVLMDGAVSSALGTVADDTARLAAVVYSESARTTLVESRRVLRRWAEGRNEPPAAASFDSRTLQSSPESGARAGYDGAQRRLGSKMHRAVDRLGNLLALPVTPASEQNRAQVSELAQHVQDVTHQSVEVAVVDQGYPGDKAEQAAAEQGIQLIGVKLPEAQTGLVLLPRRWLLEPSFGCLAGFRRLARDYERLPATLKRLHFLAFAVLMLTKFVHLMAFVLSFMIRSRQPTFGNNFDQAA